MLNPGDVCRAESFCTTTSYRSAAFFHSFNWYAAFPSLKALAALRLLIEYLPQPADSSAVPHTRMAAACEAARNRMVMLSPSRADYN